MGKNKTKANFSKPLWDYAVQVYSSKEIEKVCLELQNKYHANVNIILWCCWIDAEEIELQSHRLDDVLIKIDSVSQMTVASLREVRRRLKESGNFTSVQAETINKHILNAELLIEKVLLHRLQDLTRRFIESCDDDEMENDEHVSLEYYLDFLQVPQSDKYASFVLDACLRQQTRRLISR